MNGISFSYEKMYNRTRVKKQTSGELSQKKIVGMCGPLPKTVSLSKARYNHSTCSIIDHIYIWLHKCIHARNTYMSSCLNMYLMQTWQRAVNGLVHTTFLSSPKLHVCIRHLGYWLQSMNSSWLNIGQLLFCLVLSVFFIYANSSRLSRSHLNTQGWI